MSATSCNFMKKCIPKPGISSLTGMTKPTTVLSRLSALKLANNPRLISLITPPEFPSRPSPEHEFSVPQEVPRTPNIPDFDPIPPEKPADPPPLQPNPTPEFPGPPNPDPDIQPPGPEIPVPPMTPGGPEVVPPTTPEWMPPKPPDVGPRHPTDPDIPLPVA
ncbi:hypothetical protein L1887_02427 [Cichorium endivia]|nr:hypothetical protein L1887_02427 [Cichorium endivia]